MIKEENCEVLSTCADYECYSCGQKNLTEYDLFKCRINCIKCENFYDAHGYYPQLSNEDLD